MDAAELARWTRFAAKGGIGKCTAIQDCVAEREQDLMFLTNDDITVLMQLPDREGVYLGYCEGVVGHFQGSDVQFRSKLKKPVMTKRSSTTSAKSPPPISPSPSTGSTFSPRPISRSSVSSIMRNNSAALLQHGRLVQEPAPLIPLAPRHSDQHPPLQEKPFDHSKPNVRTSAAISDGEVGIGNSLLQDVANGDDWSSTHSSDYSPVLEEDKWVSPVSIASVDDGPLTPATQPYLPPRTTSLSHSYMEASSPETKVRSHSGPGEDDWEGASDIYDDYRYSRQSLASKTSRYSQNSTQSTHANNPALKVPPVPSDPRPSEGRQSSESQSSFYAQLTKTSTIPPAPLDLAPKKTVTDPPLQDYLSTPQMNASRPTPSVPPTLTPSPPSPTWAGAATALRERLEKAHRSQGSQGSLNLTQEPPKQTEDNENGGIVIDDDEEIHLRRLASRQSDSQSPSPVLATFGPSLVIANRTPSPSLSPPPTSPISSPSHARPDPPTVVQPEKQQAQSQPRPQIQPQPEVHPHPHPQARPRPPPADARAPNHEPPRTSLFLPHPNAPKPTATSSGPMYARRTSPQQYPGPSAPHKDSSVSVIRMAISSQYNPNGMVRPTIYGQCDYDLMSSTGPVPISFSLDPPKSIPAPKASSVPPRQNMPKRSATTSMTSSINGSTSNTPAFNASERSLVDESKRHTATVSNIIPRANFFPKAQTTRPRSRSFSEFNKPPNGAPMSPGRSIEEARRPLRISTTKFSMARAASASAVVPNSLISQPPIVSPTLSTRSSHAPSPLSLPQNNNVAASRTVKSPTSLSQPLSPSSLSHVGGAKSISTSAAVPPSPTTARPCLSKATVPGVADTASSPSSPQRFPPSSTSSHPKGDTPESPLNSLRARRSADGNLSHYGDLRAEVVSPPPSNPPLVRNPSLRSKMSLPNLRGKSSIKSVKDDLSIIPQSYEPDNETVQVKDMDFELIRPIISHISEVAPARKSGDSVIPSPDGRLEHSPGLLRADSPTFSMSSGPASGQRSPSTFSEDASRPRTPKASDLELSIDAHRQRELKWVHLMSAVPAAQARKNKKVRKLLLEGVPSSVRYLVWAHLTNSKARGVTGVYAQLGKRGKVPAFGQIERDVQKCFADQPRLRSTEGPVFSLLQAYLTMVPDIRYHTALTYIAGHLLLLSPEEDAFWIFVSLMDTHLRPYFSSSTIQMEVDASLFSRALETTDAPLARKIFVDMGISPAAACRPWLSSLFAETLPLDYLHRVWDLFLYEGIPFLLRVGLAICSIYRRHLLECNSEQSLLDNLFHPSSNSLPSVEAFLSLTFSIKLKDDEVRKQRIKMEAQVKRQTQTQIRALSTSGVRLRAPSVSLPRS